MAYQDEKIKIIEMWTIVYTCDIFFLNKNQIFLNCNKLLNLRNKYLNHKIPNKFVLYQTLYEEFYIVLLLYSIIHIFCSFKNN